MQPYGQFARFYHQGPYRQFSIWVAETILPHMLEVLKVKPQRLLDLACGEGSFAIRMAKLSIEVTGLERSEAMLQIAREKAIEEGVSIRWVSSEMQIARFDQEYDLVTCLFDSLNYLLQVKDLQATFKAAYQALKPGGYFIFDMNTLYGLEVEWQRYGCYLQQESPEFMEVHVNTCDYENGIASVRIIIFEKQGEVWQKFEELHQERGYACDDILLLLENCGFEVLHLIGNPETFRPVGEKDGRLWVIAKRLR